MAQRIFPDEMNIGRITPKYKDGDKEKFVEYVPISVLSCISNIYI